MFFSDYYDPFSTSPFLSRNNVLRAREMERRQQELERKRYLQRLQNQRRLQLQRQKEEETRRRLMREQEAESRRANREEYAFPPGTIIRGRDGRLYRVVADSRANDDRDDTSVSDASNDNDSCCSDSSMEGDEMNVEPTFKTANDRVSTAKALNANAGEFIPKSHNKENDAPGSKNKPKKTYTLTVEDVPFDEDEELRDLHSVWRNRAPSPGEWMEPVDSFQQ